MFLTNKNMLKNIIHFLTEFPNKILLSVLFAFVFAAYLIFQTDFLAQLSRDAFVAVLTIVGARALQNTAETVNADNVNIGTTEPPTVETTENTEEK